MAFQGVLQEKVYFYSINRGYLEIDEGRLLDGGYRSHVVRRNKVGWGVGKNRNKRKEGIFESVNLSRSKSRRRCDQEPGVVRYNCIWLSERDDKLARQIFIEYLKSKRKLNEIEIARIENLEKELEFYEKFIEA